MPTGSAIAGGFVSSGRIGKKFPSVFPFHNHGGRRNRKELTKVPTAGLCNSKFNTGTPGRTRAVRAAMSARRAEGADYMAKHGVEEAIKRALEEILRDRPGDPALHR